MRALSVAQHADLNTTDLHFAAAGQTIDKRLWVRRGLNGDFSCPKL